MCFELKKIQLMRSAFGDYRKLMKELGSPKHPSAKAYAVKKPAAGSKSTAFRFHRRCCSSTVLTLVSRSSASKQLHSQSSLEKESRHAVTEFKFNFTGDTKDNEQTVVDATPNQSQDALTKLAGELRRHLQISDETNQPKVTPFAFNFQ